MLEATPRNGHIYRHDEANAFINSFLFQSARTST